MKRIPLSHLAMALLLASCTLSRPVTIRGGAADRPSEVVLTVDAGAVGRPISPLIYGVAAASPEALTATGARLHRWGGNPSSRHNWELGNAWNAARDWEFRNVNYGNAAAADKRPAAVADRFVAVAMAAGAEPVITIPAIGWVARDDATTTSSINVPANGGVGLSGPDGGITGYDPSANRTATSLRSLARKGGPWSNPPDLTDAVVYQDEWVAHLVARFGPASAGGVRFYAIDNGPDLWSETHTDIHPAQLGYDDALAVFLEYAEAIKDVDPSALVLGPTVSGWTGYHYSALDRGSDRFRLHLDRRTHGDRPFLAWWLEQVRRHDDRVGRRTLDYLDVHYYPQGDGVFAGATDDATSALRLRSTRSLWDETYVDESWIRTTVRLLPRLREWIDDSYPGTGLAIGEWSWGAEQTMSGALAIADVLGIFGREGVDLAAYWTVPPPGSPGALAFAMYTNYDGRGGTFGDTSLAATSNAPDDVALHASQDGRTGDLLLIALNRRSDADLPVTFRFERFGAIGRAHLYRLGQDDPKMIRDVGDLTVSDATLSLTLPSWSVSLLRVAQQRQ